MICVACGGLQNLTNFKNGKVRWRVCPSCNGFGATQQFAPREIVLRPLKRKIKWSKTQLRNVQSLDKLPGFTLSDWLAALTPS